MKINIIILKATQIGKLQLQMATPWKTGKMSEVNKINFNIYDLI